MLHKTHPCTMSLPYILGTVVMLQTLTN